ncbi:MAG: hypothetical protein QOE54_1267 [Streptosporangiaceae bacterium]|jgi:hypothetical protein|nr:hypothetical protein [Streptosporangiaceae bacterium]MDX6428901.1 hypothetical protein [Streptosporangiaceae bacterium]
MTAPEITDVHPAEELVTPGGVPVPIDVELVPVIRALWALDLRTLMCCQDIGEAMASGGIRAMAEPGRWSAFLSRHAWLKMPVDAGQALLARLDGTAEFSPRLSPKVAGGWHSAVWLSPAGLAGHANIYFPRAQVPELAATLTAMAVLGR